MLREMMSAAEILPSNDYQIETYHKSWSEYQVLMVIKLYGMEVERYNLVNPDKTPKKYMYFNDNQSTEGPIMAAYGYEHISDQIRPIYTIRAFIL